VPQVNFFSTPLWGQSMIDPPALFAAPPRPPRRVRIKPPPPPRSLISAGRLRIEDDDWRRLHGLARRKPPTPPPPPPPPERPPAEAIWVQIERDTAAASRRAYAEARLVIADHVNHSALKAKQQAAMRPAMRPAMGRPHVRLQSLSTRDEFRLNTRWDSMWDSTFEKRASRSINTPATTASLTCPDCAEMWGTRTDDTMRGLTGHTWRCKRCRTAELQKKGEWAGRRVEGRQELTEEQRHAGSTDEAKFGTPVHDVERPDRDRVQECIGTLEAVLTQFPEAATRPWQAPGVVFVGPEGEGGGRPCPLPVELRLLLAVLKGINGQATGALAMLEAAEASLPPAHGANNLSEQDAARGLSCPAVLECQTSGFINSDTRPRPTTGLGDVDPFDLISAPVRQLLRAHIEIKIANKTQGWSSGARPGFAWVEATDPYRAEQLDCLPSGCTRLKSRFGRPGEDGDVRRDDGALGRRHPAGAAWPAGRRRCRPPAAVAAADHPALPVVRAVVVPEGAEAGGRP
jgi:hypothetical protein